MNSIEAYILDWVSKTTGKTISPQDDIFFSGGLDSLNFAELIASIEEQFKIVFDFSELLDWNSLKTAHGISSFATKL